jgi:hypothetical protein
MEVNVLMTVLLCEQHDVGVDAPVDDLLERQRRGA